MEAEVALWLPMERRVSKTFPRFGKVQMKNDTNYDVIYFCFSYSSKSNELNDTLETN